MKNKMIVSTNTLGDLVLTEMDFQNKVANRCGTRLT